jgi:cytochrome b561
MDWQFDSLPLHPLIVHLVTVAFPTASLLVLVGAFWPALRRRLGVITPLIALVSLIAVPLATSSGEALEERVDSSALLEAHTQLGDTLLPWAIAVFVVAVAQWIWQRWVLTPEAQRPRPAVRGGARLVVGVVLMVLAVGTSIGGIVTTVRIGHSGAEAVWSDSSEG